MDKTLYMCIRVNFPVDLPTQVVDLPTWQLICLRVADMPT